MHWISAKHKCQDQTPFYNN
uniref:Uncharacterized protein n=1 Tax=Arundo donax TaxID=35708 RepID=A0A0A9BY67_ARUDO